MRKILFRGKCKDTGEWVYGYYLAQDGKHYISKDGKLYEVYQTTVQQFTGITDGEGTMVFEGDCVEFVGCATAEIWIIRGHTVAIVDDGEDVCKYENYYGSSIKYGDSKIIGNMYDNYKEN